MLCKQSIAKSEKKDGSITVSVIITNASSIEHTIKKEVHIGSITEINEDQIIGAQRNNEKINEIRNKEI